MQEIRAWLNGTRSYDTGVKLYMKYGTQPLLKQLFQEEYSDFKRKKLQQAMLELSKSDAPPGNRSRPPIIAGTKGPARIIDQEVARNLKKDLPITHAGWPKDMDPQLQALYDEWLPIFLEKKNLQARIYDTALAGQNDPQKKKEAGAMANKILDFRDTCRAIYDKRDYYLKNKKLPQPSQLCNIPDDPNKWPLIYQNYQRYVRDYKTKLANLAPVPNNEKKRLNYQKQLAKYEWGVTELKKLLHL